MQDRPDIRKFISGTMLLLPALLLLASIALAQKQVGPIRRARPPIFDQRTEDVFSPNAVELLQGTPPRYGNVPGAIGDIDNQPSPTDSKFSWSALVSRETLEDAVKRGLVRLRLAAPSSSTFKSGGYQQARKEFSFLAVVFGVIHQYDGDVRWKDASQGMQLRLSRAGLNCKVATDNSYKETVTRMEGLALLIRGANVDIESMDRPIPLWSEVADRSPLMSQLEQALDEQLAPGVANSTEFGRQNQQALASAEVISMLAYVIQQPDYEYAQDSEYLEYAKTMMEQAKHAKNAIRDQQLSEAQAAVGKIRKSCNACHGDYRS